MDYENSVGFDCFDTFLVCFSGAYVPAKVGKSGLVKYLPWKNS